MTREKLSLRETIMQAESDLGDLWSALKRDLDPGDRRHYNAVPVEGHPREAALKRIDWVRETLRDARAMMADPDLVPDKEGVPVSRNVKLTDAEWTALESVARREGLEWGGIPSRSEAMRLLIARDTESHA